MKNTVKINEGLQPSRQITANEFNRAKANGDIEIYGEYNGYTIIKWGTEWYYLDTSTGRLYRPTNEAKQPKKNSVKINESQLHKIITESVKKRLNEFRSYLNDDDFAIAKSDANGSAAKTWANNYANKNIKPNPQQPNNGEISEEMIDRNGDKYIEDESFPAGGGLDDRCTYNKDCIAAFDLCSSDKIAQFLSKKGFSLLDDDGFSERWQKGDTIVTFDGYANNCYGYMTTEYNPNGRINPYFVHENKLNKIVAESVKNVLKEYHWDEPFDEEEISHGVIDEELSKIENILSIIKSRLKLENYALIGIDGLDKERAISAIKSIESGVSTLWQATYGIEKED